MHRTQPDDGLPKVAAAVSAVSDGETILAALDDALTDGAATEGRDLVDVDEIAQPRAAAAEMDRLNRHGFLPLSCGLLLRLRAA